MCPSTTVISVIAVPPTMTWTLAPWPYDHTTAALTLRSGHEPFASVDESLVETWLTAARAGRFQRLRTNAVGPGVADDLHMLGFSVKQELVLLSYDFSKPDFAEPDFSEPGPAMSKHRDSDKRWAIRRISARQTIRIDMAAFGDEWALDHAALTYASSATQASRLRGAVGRPMWQNIGKKCGFYLAGYTDTNGYLQRLGVHPTSQRAGLGRALVCDALQWLQASGAERVFVNTDVHNEPALALYESLGFTRMNYTLTVMEIGLI